MLRRGSRFSRGPLTLYTGSDQKGLQVAVIADKKVSKLATQRNKVKRRIRAILRESTLPSAPIVVRALPGSEKQSYLALKTNIQSCLRGPKR